MSVRASLASFAVCVLVNGALLVTTVSAQPAKPAAPPVPSVTALMVDVTISRYQGDKRTSQLPYTIAVSPNSDRSNLRVGGEVPIPTTTFTPLPSGATKDAGTEAKPNPLQSFSYRSIGTNIDVTAAAVDDGRYRVIISVEDSSVYPPGETAKNMNTVAGAPAFRSLRSSNTLILRDGQSVDYTAATDRITGEVARISVKLTVIK
jgi:Flp pilus assembly secretin CpaC